LIAWIGSLWTAQAKQGQHFGRMKHQRPLALFKRLDIVTDWAVLDSAARLPNLTLPEYDPKVHDSDKK
jgi:hypothetical protein